MRRALMLRLLVRDFLEENPNASKAEQLSLFARLSGFTDAELELLVSQLEKKEE